MARNVEVKARLSDISVQRGLVAALTLQGATLLEQHDTFFHVPRGRLKLRLLSENLGELIHYERADQTGPKVSSYSIHRTTSPLVLRSTLEAALGVLGVVEKTRELYLAGRTRIHLDRVGGLGDFLELEVVLEPGEESSIGEREAERLMTRLEISPTQLIDCAYVDLLECVHRRR